MASRSRAGARYNTGFAEWIVLPDQGEYHDPVLLTPGVEWRALLSTLEIENVFDRPGYEAVTAELKAELRRLQDLVGDMQHPVQQ